MIKNFKLALVIICALVVLILLVQNDQLVETRIAWMRFETPLVVLLFASLIVGFLLGTTVTVTIFSKTNSQKTDTDKH